MVHRHWFASLLIVGTLFLLASSHAAAQTAAAPATSAPGIAGGELLNSDGTLNLKSGREGSVDIAGWNVSLDPQRGPVFTRDDSTLRGGTSVGGEHELPALTPSIWSALRNGVSNTVDALAVSGNNVYVGGFFTQVCGNAACNSGNTTVNHVARWNGISWSPLGNGVSDIVTSLAVSAGNVYVGGLFQNVCGNAACNSGNTTVNNIARWNGSSWSALGNGVSDRVTSLAASGSNVYVGGLFQNVCGNTACNSGNTMVNYIAQWNGSSWSALGNGVDNGVDALAASGSNLYVGGAFVNVCGNAACNSGNTIVNNVAQWNGSSWSGLANGLDFTVFALAVSGSNVYVGGIFQNVCGNAACNSGNTTVNNIAQWNGSSWSGLGNGVDKAVIALAASGSNVYVGGLFQNVCGNAACNSGNTAMNYIAQWNGNSWSPVRKGVDTNVQALALGGTTLNIGGQFTQTCGNAACNSGNTIVNRIAQFACVLRPGQPTPLAPPNGSVVLANQVLLEWTGETCPVVYDVQVRLGTTAGKLVGNPMNLPGPEYTTMPLLPGHSYSWRARGEDSKGAGLWTPYWSFKVSWAIVPW